MSEVQAQRGGRRALAVVAVLAVAVASVTALRGGDPRDAPAGIVATRALSRPDAVAWSSGDPSTSRLPVAGAQIDPGVVVVTSTGGHHGFDRDSGDLRWRIPLALAHEPAVLGGGLLVATSHGSVVAFDADDGSRLWTWRDPAGRPDDHEPAPVFVGLGSVFAVTAPDVLTALDVETAERSWTLPFRTDLAASLAGIVGHAEGLLHVLLSRPAGATGPTVNRSVAALDPASGEVRWEVDAPLGGRSDTGTILVPLPDGEVREVDPSSGEVVGSHRLPFLPPEQPPEAGIGSPLTDAPVDWLDLHGDVILAAVEGRMAAIHRGSGGVRWTRELPDEHARIISVDATSTYVATPSVLVAVDLRDGTVRQVDQHEEGPTNGWTGGEGGLIVSVDGRDPSVTVRSGAQVRWTASIVAPTSVRTVPAGRSALVVPTQGSVRALDVGDGGVLWESPAGQRGPPLAAAAAVGQRVLLVRPTQGEPGPGSGWTELAAVEATTGEDRWTRPLAEDVIVTGGLVAAGDLLYLSTMTGVAAHRVATGRPRFVLSTDGLRIEDRGAVTDLVVRGDTLAFVVGPGLGAPVAGDRLLVVADAGSGGVRWQRRLSLSPCGRPFVSHDAVVLRTTAGLTSLDLADGRLRWTSELPRPSCWAPVAAGGIVVVAGDTSSVLGLDATTGDRVWTTDLGRPISAPPVVAGDGLLVPAGDRLVELALTDGATRWQLDVPHRIDAPPAVVGGTLLLSDAAGRRTALR